MQIKQAKNGCKEFLEAQGNEMKPAIIHQDNQSTIILATSGKTTGQRTRHIDIRYFAVKDLVQQGEVKIVYTETEEMLADMFTKALKGKLFWYMRDQVLNTDVLEAKESDVEEYEGLGKQKLVSNKTS